ncbi:MAG: hypothetical protein ACSHXK_13640 [Oceanococcus sp.]
MISKLVIVNDRMQADFKYLRSEPVGSHFHADFAPELTPHQMLELGVFGGKYMTDCIEEFPIEWFSSAKFSPNKSDPKLNYFSVNASQALKVWQEKGWLHEDDPRGWFQWYCRYFSGRRMEDDERQIRRWKGMKRHATQVQRNCSKGDYSCRPKQRQALLHWAYDSRNM